MRIAVRTDLAAPRPRRHVLLTVVVVMLAALGMVGASAPTGDGALGLDAVVEDALATNGHAGRRDQRVRRRRRRRCPVAMRRRPAPRRQPQPAPNGRPARPVATAIRRRGPPLRRAA
jgi:hypothetical protein